MTAKRTSATGCRCWICGDLDADRKAVAVKGVRYMAVHGSRVVFDEIGDGEVKDLCAYCHGAHAAKLGAADG